MLTKFLLLGAALLAAACQATNPAANSTAQPPAVRPASAAAGSLPPAALAEPAGGGSEKLYAHRWALAEAAAQPVAPAGNAREAHLLFFPPNRLSGSTGCNRLSGTFELMGGGQVKFSPLATTRMMCPEPAVTAETRFVQALGTVKTYYVTDTALELRDGTAVVARFRATPATPEK